MRKLTPKVMEEYRQRPRPARWRVGTSTRNHMANALAEASLNVLAVYDVEETGEVFVCPLRMWGKVYKTTDDCDIRFWSKRPNRASQWRHYKGGIYRVVTNAFHALTGQHFIIYRSDKDNVIWARDAASWFSMTLDDDLNEVPRFELIP